MKTKVLLAGMAYALWLAPESVAQATDHKFHCQKYQNEWADLSNGTPDKMKTFLADPNIRKMCPVLESQVASRIVAIEQQIREQAAREAELSAQIASAQAQNRELAEHSRRELQNLQNVARQEREARIQAQARADEQRAAREALEAAAQIPGRPRNLISCSTSQDVERIDQGNIPNVKFENIIISPETQVVYDIADIAEGVIDIYGVDLKTGQWNRTRTGAQRKGNVLTIGGTRENEQNLRLRERSELNLDAMTVRGRGMLEAASLNTGSLLNYDLSSGNGSFNLGALTQRGPRLWLELRGNCAYENGEPPGPLTGTPEFRTTSRDIPTIPK